MSYSKSSALLFYNHILAFNLHLSDRNPYDFFKYNGKVRASEDSFKTYQYKHQIINLTKSLEISNSNDIILILYYYYRLHGYVNINMKFFKDCLKLNIHTVKESIVDDIVNDFDTKIKNLCYNKDLLTSFVMSKGDLYPLIYELYKNNEITLETLLTINNYVCDFLKPPQSRDTILWPKETKKLNKLKGFVSRIVSKRDFDYIIKAVYG